MKGDPLTADHHVVRYVSPGKRNGGEIDGSVFVRGAGDTDGLSVSWVEHWPGSAGERLAEIRARRRITWKANGVLAEINVGRTVTALRATLATIAIVEDPLEAEGAFLADASHSLILSLPDPGTAVADLVGDMIRDLVERQHSAL